MCVHGGGGKARHTAPLSFTIITPVTGFFGSLLLVLLELSLSLSWSLTLPLHERVVIDAKEDKEFGAEDVSAKTSLY